MNTTIASPCRSARALFAASALCVPAAAYAVDATTSFGVTATVVATCAVSATALAFGNYSAAQLDGTSTVTVTCTNGAAYTVALNAGTGSGATVATRKMTGPATQTLDYTLYRDSGRTLVWGETVGVDRVVGVGNGAAQSLSVYGRVFGSQFPGAGAYSDTIAVAVTY